MVGSAARDLLVVRQAAPLALCIFLERGLGVGRRRRGGGHERLPELAHHSLGGPEAAIDIDCAEQRFAGIGEDHGLLAPAGSRLAQRHDDMRAEIEEACDLGAGTFADKRIKVPGKLHLAGLGKQPIEQSGDGEAQHAVAQKLQPLVIVAAMGRARAGMG